MQGPVMIRSESWDLSPALCCVGSELCPALQSLLEHRGDRPSLYQLHLGAMVTEQSPGTAHEHTEDVNN